MALFSVIKYQGNDSEFAWKHPSSELSTGSQLVVNTAQTAFFVKGGVIYDQFGPGTYTLSSNNIPLLSSFINLPFGGKSPFTAEVWYINQINKLDCKWGTTTPIQLEDPKYGIIVPIRAYGQYGLKVSDPRRFLETLVGNMTSYSGQKVIDYFKGKLMSALTSLISQKMTMENMSVLEINAQLDNLSEYCRQKINFSDFGVEVVNFYFMSINVPEDDESLRKLKEAKDIAAQIKIMGRDIYQMDKSFDVLEKASENEGISSAFMGAGVGMGVGVGVGSQMAGLAGNINVNAQTQPAQAAPPPPPPTESIFLFENNQQEGPYTPEQLKAFVAQGKLKRSTYVWKQGMAKWEMLENEPSLAYLLGLMPPPPPPPAM